MRQHWDALLSRAGSIASGIGLILLGACSDGATSVTAPASTSLSLPTYSVATDRGTIDVFSDRIKLRGRGASVQLTPELRALLRKVDDAEAGYSALAKKFGRDARVQRVKATRRGAIDRAKVEERNARLGGRSSLATAGSLSGFAAMVSGPNCDDIAIAIYETDELYKNALDSFYNEMASAALDAVVDQSLPGVSDMLHLATAAYEVWLFRSSLDMLATLYSAGGCW